MPTFTDATGQSWSMTITRKAAKLLRLRYGVDVRRLDEEQYRPLAALFHKPERFLTVVYHICKEQADHRKLSLTDFIKALCDPAHPDRHSAVSQELCVAFMEALALSSSEPKVRNVLRQIIQEHSAKIGA